MSGSRKRERVSARGFEVGQRVRFHYVQERVSGVIMEDRGQPGGGGMPFSTVRARVGRAVPIEIVLELPPDELRAA